MSWGAAFFSAAPHLASRSRKSSSTSATRDALVIGVVEQMEKQALANERFVIVHNPRRLEESSDVVSAAGSCR